MRTLSLSAPHTISLYSSIHELPVVRHLEFQLYTTQTDGIGSTVEDIDRRFTRTGQLLAAGKTVDAGNELANLHYAFQFIFEKHSPISLAFLVLVAEVDGIPTTDFSEEALQALLQRLSGYGLTMGQVEEEVASVKKKLATELATHFPELFSQEGEELAIFNQRRRRLVALGQWLLTQEPRHLDAVQQVDSWLLDLGLPHVFDDGDPQNILVQLRRTFAKNCAVLGQQGTPQAELLTVFQFQARVALLEEQLKERAK